MAELDEHRLVERLRKRDERAFTELMHVYQARVFYIVFRMLGNRAEAEDVTQEVFITIFKAIDSFRGDSKLSTWVFRIAVNHAKNRKKYLGRRNHETTVSYEETARTRDVNNPYDRPDHVLEGHESEKVVQQALAALDEEQRSILILRDVENLSYEEIQQITNLAEGTVKSRLHRARSTFREHVHRLSEEGEPNRTAKDLPRSKDPKRQL